MIVDGVRPFVVEAIGMKQERAQRSKGARDIVCYEPSIAVSLEE